ncbi:MAG: NADH-quinone oxidoreductase subunit L [Candidatus Eisenbacteria bacterium]|nr:NADH-quinone oxidoreductase subunit L [Candidatus Eisenbacteria bacterium]
MEFLIPFIPLFPLLAFVITIFFGRKLPGHGSLIPVLFAGASLSASLIVITSVLAGGRYDINLNWFVIGDLPVTIGYAVDELAALMLLVVSVVGFLVILYSVGYMHGDERHSRYFAFISLFLFSMYGLVLANTFFVLFIFWELVGLCSYLLIGFWFEKKSASDAGTKAFITTRLGDLGFLVGIFFFVKAAGSFQFKEVFGAVQNGALDPHYLKIAAICLFGGAVGKSAQFPLHVWLPDAMEGPTPVSALIHAATMVAAGVYMVARCFPIYAASPAASMVVATIGGITAILAATIACTQFDIKRVLAYSTVSQLGYMVFALGAGGYTAGMFHLYTHAFFKALLFLGAGSVIHGLHTQDIREMGGLGKQMKITATTFIIAALALSGIPPLSGFWSKDEILSHCISQGHIFLYAVGTLGAFLTSFYMFRLCFLVFLGKPRTEKKAKESPAVMTIPLIVLGVLSVVSGFVGMPWLPHGISSFIHFGEVEHAPANYAVMLVSTLVCLLGIGVSYLVYLRHTISEQGFAKGLPWLYRLLYNKYYLDEIYLAVIIRPLVRLTRALFSFDLRVIDGAVDGTAKVTILLSRIKRWIDEHVVDGLVNGIASVTQAWSWLLRRAQSGYVQQYVMVILLGILFLLAVKLFV